MSKKFWMGILKVKVKVHMRTLNPKAASEMDFMWKENYRYHNFECQAYFD